MTYSKVDLNSLWQELSLVVVLGDGWHAQALWHFAQRVRFALKLALVSTNRKHVKHRKEQEVG